MIDIQYYTFWWQNVSSSIIYVLALMSIGTLVNLNPSWAYDPNVILGNEDFNVFLTTTIIMGVLSLTFAKNPSWLGFVKSMQRTQLCISLSSLMTNSHSSDHEVTQDVYFAKDSNAEKAEFDDVDGGCITMSTRFSNIEKCDCDNLSQDSSGEEKGQIKYDDISSEDVVLRKEKNVTFNERAWINSFQHSSSKNFHRDRDSIKSWVETSSPRAVKSKSELLNNEIFYNKFVFPQEFDLIDGKYENLNDGGDENYFPKKPRRNNNCLISIPKEWIIRILIGMTCVILVLGPIIIASLFMNLGSNRSSYIYYTHENKTVVTQVCLKLINFELWHS